LANSSITGATILQGPHHVAQKSTSTGISDSMTSFLKFDSVKCVSSIVFSGCFQGLSQAKSAPFLKWLLKKSLIEF
jgi:hypothetical protein